MTGAVINLNFVTGLDYDTGIAAVGKNLFVAYQYQSPQIAYATIAEYAATTGAVISTDLLSDVLGTGSDTGPLAVSGKSILFGYYNTSGEYVGEYNTATAAITPNFIYLGSYPFAPSALTVSKNHLFVGYGNPTLGGTVAEYDAATGDPINLTFVTGLTSEPGGLAVLGNHLLVADGGGVSEYNATTGKVINANFINFGSGGASQLVVRGN